MATVILDTTVLSNFAHIRRPDLLLHAFGHNANTAPAVIAELRTGEMLGVVPRCDWRQLHIVVLTEDEQRLAVHYLSQLDEGESECLAVATSRSWTFATDDLAARRLAQHGGVAVSGSLGALRVLVVSRYLLLDEADKYLAMMCDHGYRSPVRSLRELMDPSILP